MKSVVYRRNFITLDYQRVELKSGKKLPVAPSPCGKGCTPVMKTVT